MEIKAKTLRVDGEDLPASSFLIVGDRNDTSTWKLPWKFSTEDKTKAHLRNALARFNQITGVSQTTKDRAYARLKKLCKRYGIDVADDGKAGIFEQKQFELHGMSKIADTGSFEGLLSPYGNVDDGGDVVEKGAYAKTLAEHGNKVPLLWQHKSDSPIGELTLDDRADGLYCKGQLLMDLPDAQKAHVLIKSGVVKGLSIGFKTVKDAIEKGARHLKELRLYEGSIVTFPMNEMAQITGVKQTADAEPGEGSFAEELEDAQTMSTYYQMYQALQSAVSMVTCSSEMSNDEKVTAVDGILQDFHDAFIAFYPDYLDTRDEVYSNYYSRGDLEGKAGAQFSAANIDKFKSACAQIKAGHDSIMALFEDKAGAATLSRKAAAPPPEPAPDHSALAPILTEIVSVLAAK